MFAVVLVPWESELETARDGQDLLRRELHRPAPSFALRLVRFMTTLE